MTDRIQDLQSNVLRLTPRDANFANSLIDNYYARGSLTDRQWYWVKTLTDRAQAPAVEEMPQLVNVGSFAPVNHLFANAASSKLKNPKIRLAFNNARLVLARAKNNPNMYVISDGTYGGNYFGRITVEGEWMPSVRGREVMVSLLPLLRAFAADPIEIAAEHGKMLGNCCFCGKPLDDARSTIVGYGPICSRRFNLPWGF